MLPIPVLVLPAGPKGKGKIGSLPPPPHFRPISCGSELLWGGYTPRPPPSAPPQSSPEDAKAPCSECCNENPDRTSPFPFPGSAWRTSTTFPTSPQIAWRCGQQRNVLPTPPGYPPIRAPVRPRVAPRQPYTPPPTTPPRCLPPPPPCALSSPPPTDSSTVIHPVQWGQYTLRSALRPLHVGHQERREGLPLLLALLLLPIAALQAFHLLLQAACTSSHDL